MLILACDTSGPAVSTALYQDGSMRVELTREIGLRHARTFVPQIEETLCLGGRTLADVDVLAAVNGPGSYTGLRIGLAAVQAMAYASGIPAIGVSALAALARPFAGIPGLLVCPAIDARNDRVFCGTWTAGRPVIQEANRHLDDWASELAGWIDPLRTTDILLVGLDNPRNAINRLSSVGSEQAARVRIGAADRSMLRPRAAAVAEIAAEMLTERGRSDFPAVRLQACYLAVPAPDRLKEEHARKIADASGDVP